MAENKEDLVAEEEKSKEAEVVVEASESARPEQEIVVVPEEKEAEAVKETKKEDKKDKKEDKKKKKEKKEKKGGLGKKIKETGSELKKVTWPTFGQVMKKTGVVLVVVAIFTVVLFGMDTLLGFLFGLLVPGTGA